jgi:hypothetical protein
LKSILLSPAAPLPVSEWIDQSLASVHFFNAENLSQSCATGNSSAAAAVSFIFRVRFTVEGGEFPKSWFRSVMAALRAVGTAKVTFDSFKQAISSGRWNNFRHFNSKISELAPAPLRGLCLERVWLQAESLVTKSVLDARSRKSLSSRTNILAGRPAIPCSSVPHHTVSSRQIALLCDFKPSKSGSHRLKSADYDALFRTPESTPLDARAATVFVNTSALPEFMCRIWPKIARDRRIVLITGDSDFGAPGEIWRRVKERTTANAENTDFVELRNFLSDRRLKKWFVQNYDFGFEPQRWSAEISSLRATDLAKIVALPIGLDFHTLAEKTSSGAEHRWGTGASVHEQQGVLDAIVLSLPHVSKRRIAVMGSKFSRTKKRRRVVENVKGLKLVDLEPLVSDSNKSLLPNLREGLRTRTWRAHGKYVFVLSPPGYGLDCHRTWEALVLGCIPIVQSDKRNPLFEGLPVVTVDTWEEVTDCAIEKWHKEMIAVSRFWSGRQRLEMAYWENMIAESR